MITRIEIASNVYDSRAAVLGKQLTSLPLSGTISSLSLLDVYTIDKTLTKKELTTIAKTLANPVTQSVRIRTKKSNGVKHPAFTYAVETGFLPGVTDNIANTVREMVENMLKVKFNKDEGVYASQMLLLRGQLTEEDCKTVSKSLINPLIQRSHIKSRATFKKDGGMDLYAPRVALVGSQKVSGVDLSVPDEELVRIGREGIKNPDGSRRGPLALDLSYMKAIQKHFKNLGRNPTDIELESIAQTWSEHCKHTIFADPLDNLTDGLFKTYIKRATENIRKKKGRRDIAASVFTDNSGAIHFDKNFLITHKVETHNSPSALDPFGGAVTGIVGVNRDTIGFGLGAKPIANTYGYCFANPFTKRRLFKDRALTQEMHSPRRILNGVIAGVNNGGNCSGIPTPQGFVFFEDRYQGKPLVFVGTVGLIPKLVGNKKSFEKRAKPGDYIVMIGGRVGADGIHGATFSSVALDSGSPATAVQIGDPITQKKLSDAIVKEARDEKLFHSITDNGAGGLSCSVAEMARESWGCVVKLEKVPLKYPGLAPWEIWISESQERMTLAVPKGKWKKFFSLMKRRGVEATIIGMFTSSGKCIVTHKGKRIVNLDMEFLHNGLPTRHLQSVAPRKNLSEPVIKPTNFNKEILSMLSSLNAASFEFISQQYDHIVQGQTVSYPLSGRGRVNSDLSIIRPVLSSNKGVVLSQALYPLYGDIDSYHMATAAIDTAVRNIIVAGANPDKIALLDNFCWCSSTDPERLYELKEAVKACFDASILYEAPFISGKDSMFNDFKGYLEDKSEIKVSVPPTVLISSIGIIDSVEKAITLDVKFAGDLLYLIGETHNELGGSEFYNIHGHRGKNVPRVEEKQFLKQYKAYYSALNKNLIVSGISVNRGGLAVALLRASMGGMKGVNVSLSRIPGNVTRDEQALFSESQGRILVSVHPDNKKAFEKELKGLSYAEVGIVEDNKTVRVQGVKKKNIINLTIKEALVSYRKTFKNF